MTTINIVLGVISIIGGLLLGVVPLAFVVASWINQPPIRKRHLAQSLEKDLGVTVLSAFRTVRRK